MSTAATQPTLGVRDLLKEHVKTYSLSPSQVTTLVLNYESWRVMFPEVPFALFLERSRRLAGATKENLLFVKDALDFYCPTKESQFPPKYRTELLMRHIEVSDLLAAEGGSITLADFLKTEVPVFLAEISAAPAVATPPATQPAQPVTTPTAAVPVLPATPVTAPQHQTAPVEPAAQTQLREGMGTYTDQQGQVHHGLIYRLFTQGGQVRVAFMSQEGVHLEDAPPDRCAVAEGAVTPTAKLKVPKDDWIQAAKYLAAPATIGSTPVGEPLMAWRVEIPAVGYVEISVYNANPRPAVDAVLYVNVADGPGEFQQELPSRYKLEGYYPFTYQQQIFLIEVVPPSR